jgi:hypothetical protein
MNQINPDKQFEILRWLLGAQEGQWLVRTAAAYGAVESLKLYGKVRATQAKAEMKAMLTLAGKTKAETLSEAAQILQEYIKMVYGERGWLGTFKLSATEANNNGTVRLEIEVSRFTPLENAKKIGQSAPEALTLLCDSLWGGWFEALLPEAELHVSTQLAGTNGRIVDTFIVSAYDPNMVLTMPIMPLESASPPLAASPIAELLQIPLGPVKAESLPAVDPYGLSTADLRIPAADNPASLPNSTTDFVRPASRLQQAMQKRQGDNIGQPQANIGQSDRTTTGQPPANSGQPQGVAPTPNPVDPLTVPHPTSPNSAPAIRDSYYQTDFDQKARDNVDKSKRKNPAIMQKIFLSKEARELLADSSNKPEQPQVSIAGGIEGILQRLIAQELAVRPGSITVGVHVMTLPSGGVQIRVGDRVYEAVSDVPPGRIRELIQQAVAEWSEQL